MRLQWLVIVITLLVTFSTFGQPLLFDRLFAGLLVLTASVSVKWDKNLFTLCLLYIAGFALEEFTWHFSRENRLLLVPAYFYLLYACYLSRYSLTGKISIVFAVCGVAAEVYWFSIDREGPRIFWYAFLCANVLIVKHLVLLRPHFCSIKFPRWDKEWAITKTDIDIGYVLALRIFLEFLNLGEYLIRHIIGYPTMIIYNYYSYLGHAVFAIAFYFFLRSFAETLKAKLLPA